MGCRLGMALTAVAVVAYRAHAMVCGEDEGGLFVSVKLGEKRFCLAHDGVDDLDVSHVFLVRRVSCYMHPLRRERTFECGR